MNLSDFFKGNELNGSKTLFAERQNITAYEKEILLKAKNVKNNDIDIQLRLMGDLEKVLHTIHNIKNIVKIKRIGFCKLEIDKNCRCKKYMDSQIRAYLTIQ